MTLLKKIKTAFLLLLFFTVLTGFIYPVMITQIARYFFSWQANGSFIQQDGRWVGSQLIGQNFTSEKYFWGRPSATTPFPYNAENSSGSNIGPMNPILFTAIQARLAQINSDGKTRVPVDFVTTSASGLDPDISPLAAYFQIPRIAKARGISDNIIRALVEKHVQKRALHVFGARRVNVLALNIDLDRVNRP